MCLSIYPSACDYQKEPLQFIRYIVQAIGWTTEGNMYNYLQVHEIYLSSRL